MTTWSYGGVALSSYGKVTMIDDDLDIAERRGNNIQIPYQHGTSFVKKFYDERKISFGVAIHAATAGALEILLDSLKSSLGLGTLQVLSQTREDSTVKRESAIFLRCVIEFTLPFPFFRLSTSIADNTTIINANPKAMTVTNPGGVEEVHPTIILTGPLQNTVITNSTNGCILTYTGTIASPRIVTISYDTTNRNWIASDDLAANKIALLTHSGDGGLFKLDKGVNTLSIADSTHTTGTVKITFKAPYL
jgi:hypothetical protein